MDKANLPRVTHTVTSTVTPVGETSTTTANPTFIQTAMGTVPHPTQSVWREVNSGVSSDPQHVGRAATGGNPYRQANQNYQRWRPEYSLNSAYYALDPRLPAPAPHRWFIPGKRKGNEWAAASASVLDVGAGTGKFTASLLATGAQVTAVEPAPAMAQQLRQALPQVHLVEVGAETMAQELPDTSFDVITFAQCWHWLKPAATSENAAQLLTENGHIAILFHQLNVSFPWVKRLSRVMRSGDVHFPDRPPKVGSQFESPRLRLLTWGQKMLVSELFELAKTRSSYLRATPAGQAHLQQNLKDFLLNEQGLKPDQTLTLPYYTLIWTAQKKSGSKPKKRRF